jgi:hypothetical protein
MQPKVVSIEISKNGGKTWKHAAGLIEQREARCQMFADIKHFEMNGNVDGTLQVLNTPAGKIYGQKGKGYNREYRLLTVRCQAADNEEAIDTLCEKYPAKWKKKTRKKNTWAVYVEQRKEKWRNQTQDK